jgi:hypothetical protein
MQTAVLPCLGAFVTGTPTSLYTMSAVHPQAMAVQLGQGIVHFWEQTKGAKCSLARVRRRRPMGLVHESLIIGDGTGRYHSISLNINHQRRLYLLPPSAMLFISR